MAQRSIEILIGRLVTDETFRSAFRADAVATLTGFAESGYDLTALEIVALRATPLDAWERAAEQIDPRLQKASLCRVEERRSSDWKVEAGIGGLHRRLRRGSTRSSRAREPDDRSDRDD